MPYCAVTVIKLAFKYIQSHYSHFLIYEEICITNAEGCIGVTYMNKFVVVC